MNQSPIVFEFPSANTIGSGFTGGLTPEQFGAIGDGDPANMAADTHGWQAVIDESAATGIPVTPRGSTYIIDGYKGDHVTWSPDDLSKHGGLVMTDGARILGSGAGQTILRNGAANWRSVIRIRSGTVAIRDLTVDGDIDNRLPCLLGPEDATHGSVRGEGIIFEGAGIVDHFELIRLDIRNTGHYGIGLENVSIKGGIIDSPFFSNIGGDCIDGKYYDPAVGGFYKKNIYIYNLRTLDGAVNHYPGKYLPTEGNTDQTVVDMCAGMHLHGAFIAGFNCTGATQTETTAIRFRPKVTGQLVGPAGASASLIRINSTLAPGTGNNASKNVVGVSIEDDNCHLSDVVIQNCYKGLRVVTNADGVPLSGSLTDISIADCTSSDASSIGLEIGGTVKGIFGRNIAVRGCETGVRLSCTNSDLDLRIEDSAITQLQASDNVFSQNRVKVSFGRLNVTPSVGDLDVATAPLVATSLNVGVSPLAASWGGEIDVLAERRAYVNLIAMANDNAYLDGPDPDNPATGNRIYGGIQVFSADVDGTGVGLRGSLRAKAQGPSGATGYWEFSSSDGVTADLVAFQIGPSKNSSMLPLELPQFTIATLPAAAGMQVCLAMISNPVGNKRLVFSDGTIWRYPDGTAV